MDIGRYRVTRCRYGWMLREISEKWAIPISFDLYGEYSESEVACLRHYIRPGDTIIDVGANIGDLSIPMAQMAGPTGSVYAFEANPVPFNQLCANVALNDAANIRPVNAFVAREGDVQNPYFTGTRWPIQTISIDSMNLTSCDLIKIDVDGGERNVLLSAEKTITAHRPILYFENDVEPLSHPLLATAFKFGYDLYWHLAPVFNQDNYLKNQQSHWNFDLLSLMVLGLPTEKKLAPLPGMRRIHHPGQFWNHPAPSIPDPSENVSWRMPRPDITPTRMPSPAS